MTGSPLDVLRRRIANLASQSDDPAGEAALAQVETLVWRGVLLSEACERMGDRGIEESAPNFRDALAPFVSGSGVGREMNVDDAPGEVPSRATTPSISRRAPVSGSEGETA